MVQDGSPRTEGSAVKGQPEGLYKEWSLRKYSKSNTPSKEEERKGSISLGTPNGEIKEKSFL